MANEEHLKVLLLGVDTWNHWRLQNEEVIPDLTDVKLGNINLSNINFSNTELCRAQINYVGMGSANLYRANLYRANFSNSNLEGADLRYAKLSEADFSFAWLGGTDLRYAELYNAKFVQTYLGQANLGDAKLCNANFNGAGLRNVDFSNSDLTEVSFLRANFKCAILTGACIQDWNINSSTSFANIKCEYVYQGKRWDNSGVCEFIDRLPKASNLIFKEGEFETLIRKQQDVIDLVFVDGIDWQAFFQSFQELREEFQSNEVSIQAIERKDANFVVRLVTTASPEEQGMIEASAKKFYAQRLSLIEAQLEDYRGLLKNERQQNSKLITIVETMAKKEESNHINITAHSVTGAICNSQYLNRDSGNINVSNLSAEESKENRWGQIITVAGILIAALTLIVTVTVPEVRCFFKLEKSEICNH
jgi:hypothetical protein